ncbi:hypothetical protein [Asticcacaulis benevestitus]|uniref:Uncharacterized protein n=1 Tax=Asticcacaulis benevestitus DSM 16100 = ATCC BAA-896 TaxID=1121022 RepID=V4NB59_9CAUL|nr:hypothetical protein [Asticcacaulis benevestitus]ESQ79127.1 hypothetical protein ABENE_22865 [Asticcacaulis benevestitus DSM 16100 = ATCC BAA-896]
MTSLTDSVTMPLSDLIEAHRAAQAAVGPAGTDDAAQVHADMLAIMLCARSHDVHESDEDGMLVEEYCAASDGSTDSLGFIDALPVVTLQALRNMIAAA